MQLKELGVKGLTGKNKAELYQMLLDARPPLIQPKKRERKPAPAPVPEPVMKAKPASEEKKVKVDSLAKYLKPYKGEYQDYTDSEEREVIYPTVIIKKLIKMAYEGEPFEKIHTTIGYSPEETKTMLYDHYEGRIDIDHPKTYEPRKTKSEIYAELVREAEKKKSVDSAVNHKGDHWVWEDLSYILRHSDVHYDEGREELVIAKLKERLKHYLKQREKYIEEPHHRKLANDIDNALSSVLAKYGRKKLVPTIEIWKKLIPLGVR